MLQFLWVFGSCQADFVYVPIYMSCYDLHTATEKNQKAREALEAFMSRLQASGPSLWQRWEVLEAGSARQPRLELLQLLLPCYPCWLLLYSGQSMTVLHFAVWDMLNLLGFTEGFACITPPQPEGLTHIPDLVPTFDMIFAMINIRTSIDIQTKRCESTNALDKIPYIHKDAIVYSYPFPKRQSLA